jgi:hypothetical protein
LKLLQPQNWHLATKKIFPKGQRNIALLEEPFYAKGADDAKRSSTIGTNMPDSGLARIAAKATKRFEMLGKPKACYTP